MKKRGLLIAMIALLAFAGIMGSMAYSKATLNPTGNLLVSNTKDSLLALYPAENLSDETAVINSDGHISFSFGKGIDGTDYGLQNFSTYEWDQLFLLKNNSNNPLNVKVWLRDVENIDGKFEGFLELGNNGQWQKIYEGKNNQIITNQKAEFANLAPGDVMPIGVKLYVHDSVTMKDYGQHLQVEATPVDSNLR